MLFWVPHSQILNAHSASVFWCTFESTWELNMPQTEIVIRLGPEEENQPSQTWSHPLLPCLRKGHPDRKARELGVHPDAPFLPSCIQSFICCCCCCLVTKSCLTLATPWTLLDRILWPWGFPGKNTGVGDAISSSRGFSWPRDWTQVYCLGRWVLYHWATRETNSFIEPCHFLPPR